MAIIEFEGLGEELLGSLRDVQGSVSSLRKEFQSANQSIKEGAQENIEAMDSLGKSVEGAARVLHSLNKESGSKLGKNIEDAADSAEDLSDDLEAVSLKLVKATFAADQYRKQQRQIRADVARVTDEIAKGVITQEEGLEVLEELAKEYAAIGLELAAIEKAARQVADNMGMTEAPALTLRTQLQHAKAELDQLIAASDGRLTPELIAAAEKAGELQSRMSSLNATVNAFNPEAKFQAFSGVLGNVANGIQAVVAGMGLASAQSNDLVLALLRIQQTTAFVQGLQGFLNGLQTNLRNIRTLIVASTVATRADSAAKTANAAATTTQATATTAAAAASNGFAVALGRVRAAFLATPFGAVAVAILAIGAALVTLMQDTRDYAKEVQDLNDHLDRLTQKRFTEIDNKLRLQQLQAEQEMLEAGETEAAKIRQREIDYQNKRNALVAKRFEMEANIVALESQRASMEGKSGEEAEEARKELGRQIEAARDAYAQFNHEIEALERENTNNQIREGNKRVEDAKREGERRLEERKKLNDNLLKLEAELQKQSQQARGSLEDDPLVRLDMERSAAREEVAILEQKIRETNAALGRGNKITEDQRQKLADILLAIEADYEKKAFEIRQQYAQQRIALIVDAGERERAEFDVQLKARLDALRKAGADEDAIKAYRQREEEAFRIQQAQKAIDLDERINIARIESIERGAETEAQYQRRIELAKLDAMEAAARQRIELLRTLTGAENEAQLAELEAALNQIAIKRDALVNSAPDFDLYDLLGIKVSNEEKARLTQSIQFATQQIMSAVSASIAAQQAQVAAQIQATDAIIDDARRRRDELQRELDRALNDQREGYANNADAIRAEIEMTRQAEAAAIEERKKHVAEQQRLAQQQARMEAIMQSSHMISTAALMIKSGAEQGGWVGAIVAAAAVAGVLASFMAIRSKIKAAEQAPVFRDGGWLDGPSHESGGVALFDRRTGKHFAEAEGGEFIVRRKSAGVNAELLEAINADPYYYKDMMEGLTKMKAAGEVRPTPEVVQGFVRSRERLSALEDGTAAEVRKLRQEVRAFMEQEGSRPQYHANRVTKGPVTRTIRK